MLYILLIVYFKYIVSKRNSLYPKCFMSKLDTRHTQTETDTSIKMQVWLLSMAVSRTWGAHDFW